MAVAAGQNPVDELDLDDLRGDGLFEDPEETDYFARGQGTLSQAQVADETWRQTDEMIRSEFSVVSPETVAETTDPLATVTHPAEVTG